MEIKLNLTQKELLNIGKEKGFLTLEDFKRFYTSPITIKANIDRFRLLKLIKETNILGKFEYIGEK